MFIIAILSAQISVLLVGNFVLLTSADRYVQDFELATQSRAQATDSRIAIAAINEDTLQSFPYRSPIDRQFLANLVTRIASAHPRAIGIDLLFDQPTVPEKDEALARVLRTTQSPIVVAYTEEPGNVTARQLAYERSFVPDRMRATPDLPKDQYGTVRTIHPGMKEAGGRYLLSFERALAEKWGVQTPAHPVPIVWHVPPKGEKSNYFEIPANKIVQFPQALYSAILGPALFKNKIVLIGSDLTLDDRHRTPLTSVSEAGNMPGVIIHAYGLSTLLDQAGSPYAGWRVNFTAALALAFVGAIFGALNLHLVPRAIALIFVLAAYFAFCIYLYHYGNVLLGLLAPLIATVASFSIMDSLTGLEARRQRQFIQGAFSNYVSPKVVDALIADPSLLSLGGDRREMTYLFTDVAHFTTMSEKMDSRDLARVLNDYFEGVTSIVLRHDGMIDKFIGDAVFAIFNAPVDLASYQERAVRCALEIDDFCDKYHKEQNAAGIDFGLTRIGVHTGVAVVGNFGSSKRKSYTAQGDAVNTAARLEGLNKHIGTRICVSGETKLHCPNIAFRPIGSVVLKGKEHAINVWEPLHEGVVTPSQLEQYNTAYASLYDPAGQALALFVALAVERPEDPCIQFHLRRLRDGIRGVQLTMAEK
jgi:adenylate cyclase